MVDEPTSTSNVFDFPGVYVRKLENDSHDKEDIVLKKANRALLASCIEAAEKLATENEDISGAVCLLFDKNNRMYDFMGGDISASNLYVMLDKLKMDMMGVIMDVMGYNTDNGDNNDGDDGGNLG